MGQYIPDFSGLNSTEFEDFCFDLISEMTFKNVKWLKGTPKSASPSDKGRDIQAEYHRDDIDSTRVVERWLFDCKHYQQGVPPSALHESLIWALAHRPSKLVFIASGYFSNPCREYVEQYLRENKPPFEIRLWDFKDLEKHTSLNSKLLLKHKAAKISSLDSPFHSAHLEVIKKPHLLSSKILFQILEQLDVKKRDKIFYHTYLQFIKPKFRVPTSADQKIGELMVEKVDYISFRKKIESLSKVIGDSTLVQGILLHMLTQSFHLGNSGQIERFKKTHSLMIKSIEEDPTLSPKDKEEMAIVPRKALLEIESRTQEFRDLYEWACEQIIIPVSVRSELEVSAKVESQLSLLEKLFNTGES